MKPTKEKLIKTLKADKEKLWNRYRKAQNYNRIDLSRANLSSADLSSADLRSADLSIADLRSADLRSANLSSADLRSANLSSADLSYADLGSAGLRSADLSYADLGSADLRSADLSSADLRFADLRSADLRSANLSSADLSSANLSSADLRSADLSNANLSNANLSSADLSSANLSNAKVNESTSFYLLSCPEAGSYTAYKKAANKIIKLFIPSFANRSSATSHKCRASSAKVLQFQDLDGNRLNIDKVKSDYDKDFVYEIGKYINVKDFDMDRWNECSTGIHHFIVRELAVNYK